MQLNSVLRMYVHPGFLSDEHALKATAEFFKVIPGRILQVEIEPMLKLRTGYTKGDSVYKFAVDPPHSVASLEYYEHRNQGAPTMGLYLNRSLPELKILGTKAEKRFSLVFHLKSGEVTSATKLDE